MKIKSCKIVRMAAVLLVSLSQITHAAKLAPEFKDLVNGTAFIHYIKVALPGELFSINGRDGVGWVYFDGSFQGETFWIRNCTNSIPGSGPMLPGCTVGASSNENWYARPDGYVAKSPRAGKSQEPTDNLVSNALMEVRCVLGLGVIKTGSLNVADDNSFNALSSDGDTLVGRFAVDDNGRPKQCEYTSSAFQKNPVVVTYGYTGRDSNSAIPSTVLQSIKMGVMESMKRQFKILDCQFGKDVVGNEGFIPQTGDSKLIMPLYRNPVIYSNSGMYQKQPNGTVLAYTEPNLFKAHRIVGWLLFIPTNMALLIWLIVRARSKRKI